MKFISFLSNTPKACIVHDDNVTLTTEQRRKVVTWYNSWYKARRQKETIKC